MVISISKETLQNSSGQNWLREKGWFRKCALEKRSQLEMISANYYSSLKRENEIFSEENKRRITTFLTTCMGMEQSATLEKRDFSVKWMKNEGDFNLEVEKLHQSKAYQMEEFLL